MELKVLSKTSSYAEIKRKLNLIYQFLASLSTARLEGREKVKEKDGIKSDKILKLTENRKIQKYFWAFNHIKIEHKF